MAATLIGMLAGTGSAVAHPEGQVCDMHAFTFYNAYLALHNQKTVKTVDQAPVIGDQSSGITILQFCDLTQKQCRENYQITQQVLSDNTDAHAVFHYFAGQDDQQTKVGQYLYEMSIVAYLTGGQSNYQDFLTATLHAEIPKSKDQVDELAQSIGLSEKQIKDNWAAAEKQMATDASLAKTLKLRKAPSVFVMPTKKAEEGQIFFSEYQQVPGYIYQRAISRI